MAAGRLLELAAPLPGWLMLALQLRQARAPSLPGASLVDSTCEMWSQLSVED